METTNIINIPEGFEIDKEKSNDRQIVLRKIEVPRTWDEYCEMMKGKDSYWFDNTNIFHETFGSVPSVTEFADKEDTEAFVALSKLIKLRKAWIGNWKPVWTNRDAKFVIIINRNDIEDAMNYNVSSALSFPTEEMRNEFIATFKDLLEIAKPLL